MKIKRLEIDNFLTVGQGQRVSLDDKGLVLIQGVNKDDSSARSNGAGKSSIADALCWALYGETARGVSSDDVVNIAAKKDTRVEVEIDMEGTSVVIARYRKHKTYKNTSRVTVGGVDATKGTEKETQELINMLIGCSREVFSAAIYAGQEEMPDLPAMTDKQLKTMIEEAAGIEDVERAYAIARERLSNEEAGVRSELTMKQMKEDSLNELKEQIENERKNADAFEATRQVRVKSFLTQANYAEEMAKQRIQKINELSQSALEEELKTLTETSDTSSAAQKALETAQTALNEEQRAMARLEALEQQAFIKYEKAQKAVESVDDDVNKPCAMCGKPGDVTDRAHLLAHRQKDVEDAERAYNNARHAVVEQQTKVTKAQVAVCEAGREVPDMTSVVKRQGEVMTLLKEITVLKTEGRSFVMKARENRTLAENAKTEENPCVVRIDALNVRLNNLLDAIAKHEEKYKQGCEKVETLKAVVKIFGPAGVRAHLLDTVTPFLNERTTDYLSALSDGNINATWTTLTSNAKGELKEKFSIEVVNSEGAATYKGLSGGEKRKVRLATALALQDLVASRAAKSVDLWIGDEIDDALDPAGLERLMGILERKARERGTVLIISHNELKDWCDSVMTITKENKQSRIEGACCE